MVDIHVSITTIPEREQRLQKLLIALTQSRGVNLDINLHVDGPDAPTIADKYETHTTTRRLGKKGYWRLVNQCFRHAQRRDHAWDYVLFVQDDIQFRDPKMIADAVKQLEYLQEEVTNVACYNLAGDGPEWDRVARWTARPVVELWNGQIFASWVDMRCVLFTPLAFEAVPVLDPPVEDREGNSSGVGRQLSLRFDLRRCAQLMVPEPVVEHRDGGTSYMNPDAIDERKEVGYT